MPHRSRLPTQNAGERKIELTLNNSLGRGARKQKFTRYRYEIKQTVLKAALVSLNSRSVSRDVPEPKLNPDVPAVLGY
jgi:hypothetical protein